MKSVDPAKYVKPSRFVKFDDGENRIRLVSNLFLYQKYGVKAGGRYISEILRAGKKPNEVFVRSQAEPKQQWGWVAYHVTQKRMGVLECGPMLGDILAKMMKESPDTFKQRDIIVTKTGEGFDTKYSAKWADTTVKLDKLDEAEFRYHMSYFGEEDE